jgi:hypothetical protein
MAIIQRPTKQGGATTFQGKIAQGYTKILASEADADIDTIFAAWNGGADTVNLRDNAVTSAKIAPGAVGTRELADGGVTSSKLATGLLDAAGGWTHTAGQIVATAVGDKVGIGTATPGSRLHVAESTSALLSAVLEAQGGGAAQLEVRTQAGADWLWRGLNTDRLLRLWSARSVLGAADVLMVDPDTGYVTARQAEATYRSAGAVLDSAYVIGGQSSNAAFTLQQFTFAALPAAGPLRGYRLRAFGSIARAAGGLQLLVWFNGTIVSRWVSGTVSWTGALYNVEVDVIFQSGTWTVFGTRVLVAPGPVAANPDVTAAVNAIGRGNVATFTPTTPSSLQLVGVFDTTNAGNSIDKTLAILEVR